MDLKLTKNKKNPQYPYRNYEFSSLEENPFDTDGGDMDSFPF